MTAQASNPIPAENLLTGNPQSEWDVAGAGDSTIQGFATNISVVPGQTAQFKIKTTAANYTINIYRMGYYGGSGARKVATIAPIVPQTQPSCLTNATSGLIDCGNWTVSASWPVPAGAVSGIYFARLARVDTGGASHIFFVVRENPSATVKSDILFQTSDTTWQAYNTYGGNSLYQGGPGVSPSRAYKVSYNRPITTRDTSPGDFVFNAEYPMVRWLEANGYHVSYSTGVDSDRNGTLIRDHRQFMAVGHDEYWSGNQRAQVEAARAAGVHLAFFTGNGVFWKTRWENSIDGSNTTYRTLVSYKETHAGGVIDPLDPPTWTGTWRDPRFSPPADGGRPENGLMGTIFRVNEGSGSTGSITVPSALGKARFWRSTSVATLATGATATLPSGILGYEWDDAPNDAAAPRGLMRLSSTTLAVGSMLVDYGSTYASGTATHNLTLYRDPSGALVFGAGTMQWSWGLDSKHDRGSAAADLRVQQATVNLFADMGVQPATIQPGLIAQTASTDVTPPLSTITSPASGASIAAGTVVTIAGTASDAGGGIVTGVEVSVDGGVTWAAANGTTSWTFSWTASGSGSVAIRSRAFDDTGNLETPSSGTLVTITAGRTCPCSIWNASDAPSPVDDGDPAAVTLGTKFRVDASGYITGVRFYKGSLNTGTHVGSLWTTTGTLLATVTFSGETASGWQQANFSSAVPVTANTTYVVSYFAPNGHYSAPDALFASAGIDNPPIHALRDGVDGANGVYAYGTASTFPTNTYLSEGYFVDVVYNTVPPPDSIAPTVTAVFPASGATSVDPAAAVTVTFSEAMDAATISSSTTGKEGTSSTGTLEIRDALNVLVPATVTYDGPTKTATLRPTIALSLLTTYTASVRGGTTEPRVKDLAGNALASSMAWSFTTAAAPPPPPTCPCTIWQPTDIPQKIDDGDPNSVELGTRFRSDVAGYITGARFYKGSLNTGTHIAKLWTNTGTLLGSATFTGETTSGWQEVAFTTPVAIAANTTYLISYHANNGHYSSSANYFAAAGVDRAPLHALRDGVDGSNGVYSYGTSAFPTSTWLSEGYFVDVVFNTSIGPDTTPPVVTLVTPAAGTSGVKADTSVTVRFNEAMNAATITGTSVLLKTPAGTTVPAAVSYAAATKTATLVPSAVLAYSTTYSIVVEGGTVDPRVKDVAGNALAADYSSTFTTAAPPPPPPTQGLGGPVLVITAASNPFTTYYAEILRTEGMTAFATADISTVTATTLASYDVAILGEMSLSAAQVTMFTNWVTGGGNLIAMKPDKQLAGLLGLTDAASTLSNGYLLVNTASGPGAGIVNQTIQFHGTADLYTLSGATSLATLYSTATAATANPAVTTRALGGGHAVAFTYALGQSIVQTRQGNPAWTGQERDGFTPVRSDDLFYGNKAGDVQPDWVNLAKVAIPQADEQQRLLWNIVLDVNAGKKPLPRFWYFPRMLKAVVIMTGDDHANGGTVGRFDDYLSRSTPGCSVDDWTCIRGTSYVFPGTPLSNVQAQSYVAQGFEVALHVNTNCADWTTTTLPQFYSTQLAQFATLWPSVPPPTTNRTHCIVWSDYATQPQVELNNGIRFDTNYYYWPDTWVLDNPGLYTGSGMPMRFTTATGQMIDVYQATSQLTDESGQTWPKNIDTLLDNALGPLGYYGAFTANMHTDFNPSAGSVGSDAIVASAQARNVPVVSARQMLDWLDGRNASRFDNIAWSAGVLSFSVEVGAGANGLRMMLPASANGSPLTGITLNGATVGFTTETIKGVAYAIVPASAGAYQASYGADINAPVMSGIGVTPGITNATATWATDEPSDSVVQYGTDPASLISTVSNSTLVTLHGLTITGLTANTTYYYRVLSTDGTGNAATAPVVGQPPFSFTTSGPVLSGSITPAATASGSTVALAGPVTRTATVDIAGNFAFANVPAGTYTVTPTKNTYGFSPQSRTVTVSSADVTGVNFTVQPVVVSGTITPAADGSGALVTLGGAALTTPADAAGAFTFSNIPDGTYTVTPGKTGFTFTPASRSVTITGGVSVTGLAFTATAVPTWNLSGTVSPSAIGSGTTLTVTGGGTATADASGNFTFTGLQDGTYTVTPAKSGYTFTPASLSVTIAGADATAVSFTANPVTIGGAVTPGAQGSGTTLTLTGGPGGTVTADGTGAYTFSAIPNGTYTVTPSKSGFTFTPASRPVTISGGVSAANVNFTAQEIPIRKISGTIAPASSGSGAVVTLTGGATATADAAGNFQFAALADGTYTVTPAKPGFTFAPASQTVTISGVDITGVNFTASPVTISGTVSPSADGSGATLTLTGGATVTADGAGNYTFAGIVNGTYTVTPSKAGFTFAPVSQSVTIAGGVSVANVNFTATLIPNRTLSGTIAPPSIGSGTIVTLSGGATTTADAGGNYTFTGLADIAYTVTPAKSGYTFTPASQSVTIAGSNVTGVNFTGQPVTLSGTISPSAAGSGATVTLTGGSGGSATTDAAGAYTFSGVANGTYTVTPSKSGYVFTPASRSVTVASGVSAVGVNFTATLPPSTVTIDATKTAGRSNRATSMASGAFSTTAGNELLLAFVAADNVNANPTTVTAVTGASLTWTLVRRTNTQRGTAEIWRAFAPGVLTNVSVTATLSQGVAAQITVMSFKGVDITGTGGSGAIGATGSGNALSGAPTASLVTTRANSLVIGVGADWDSATAKTLGPNQTMVSQFLAADGDTFWVQRTTNLVAGAGTTVTINSTAPTGDRYNLTICEIRPPQ